MCLKWIMSKKDISPSDYEPILALALDAEEGYNTSIIQSIIEIFTQLESQNNETQATPGQTLKFLGKNENSPALQVVVRNILSSITRPASITPPPMESEDLEKHFLYV